MNLERTAKGKKGRKFGEIFEFKIENDNEIMKSDEKL
jgi:hypothetical protein